MTFDKDIASQRTKALLGGEICKPNSLGEFIRSADDSYRRDVSLILIFGVKFINQVAGAGFDTRLPVSGVEDVQLEYELMRTQFWIYALTKARAAEHKRGTADRYKYICRALEFERQIRDGQI